MCFFCEKPSSSDILHEACTFRIDSRVRKCALDLQYERLLAKLSAGDMVALEAKYHARFLVAYCNKASAIHDKEISVIAQTESAMVLVCHGFC